MNFSKYYLKIISSAILLSLFITGTCYSQSSQPQTKSDFWENVRFGGGLGIGLSNGFFSATVSPTVIYEFSNDFAMGIGLNGTFNSRKNFYKSTILGGSLLSLYSPINEIQLSAEFEQLNVNRKFEDSQFKDQNYWYPALFAGAGYRTGNITVGIRYDVLYDEEKSIYPNAWVPFFRVFF